MKYLKMNKQGKFYCSYEDDAYVMCAIMGYKVSSSKTGFPIDAFGKVTRVLMDKKIIF